MLYSIDDIKRDVRVALDMNEDNAPLISEDDTDTLSLDDIIESKVCEAVRFVHREAPIVLLDSGKPFGQQIEWDNVEGIGNGSVKLPDDFLRLVCFKMSDWNYSVHTYITSDAPEYAIQKSRFRVKGNPERPVVAIVLRPTGLYLEFFSCSAGIGTRVSEARYLPMPKIDGGQIEICEKLRSAVIYYTAYLTAFTLGEMDLSERMFKLSVELIK